MKPVFIQVVVVLPCVILFSFLNDGGLAYFSPDTFEIRSQSEITLPILNTPVYRSSYSYRDNSFELVEYLVAKGYWSPRETDEPRWILLFHWNDAWRDGDTQWYRDVNRSNEWIEWTEKHPDIARVLWPAVLSFLRSDEGSRYVTHVMFQAKISSSEAEFRELFHTDPELRADQRGLRLPEPTAPP